MQVDALEKLVVTSIEDLKGTDIKVLNTEGITAIADRMIICSGRSSTHIKSIADNVVKNAKENNIKVYGLEGTKNSEWVLIDLGDIIVHVMHPSTRDYYNLEALWDINFCKSEQNAINDK